MECKRGVTMRILSARPFVSQMRTWWQKGRKICADFYTVQKTISPSFLRRRMVGEGYP